MTAALDVRSAKQLKNENPAYKHIPYSAHLTDHTVSLDNGAYIQVIRCGGASFEVQDDDRINQWHKRLNVMIRSIADTRISIWTHIVRREKNYYPEGDFPPGFAADFNKKYAEKISGELLMVNELYTTIVYQPQNNAVNKFMMKLFSATDAGAAMAERNDSLDYLNTVTNNVISSLDAQFEPERLGLYEHRGHMFSEVKEFLAFLINGEWQRMPLSRGKISRSIATSRPLIGYETVEVRTPTATQYSAMLGISEYTSETTPGILNALLSVPFEFVLTQSFAFLSRESAKFIVKTQRNRMENTGDDAKTQIAELEDLLDEIQGGQVVMGNHHFSLQVKGHNLDDLSLNVADARAELSEMSIVTAREDLALEAAFWAQLPGNFKYRPRLSPITSKNWVAFNPYHNYPTGRAENNHWGPALTLLVTEANTPLYFSYHASDPYEDDGGSSKETGDAVLLGPKGSGKTVFVTSSAAFLQKFNFTSVFFTKDRDSEIFIRAVGGRYLPLKFGVPTGINLFQLEPTPQNIYHWNGVVKSLVRRRLTVADEMQIQEAIEWVATLPANKRRLGRLLEHLDNTEDDSVYDHIKQWCYKVAADEKDGPYAFVFDNKTDTMTNFVNGDCKTIGFDITDFLEDETIRGPLCRHLFYLVNGLVDGRRIGIFISEFWKMLEDDYCAKFIKDHLKTIRKKNGFLVLDSQSPSDALAHPIARTLIEQTPTKILFPNVEADEDEYCNGLSLSNREFLLIKEELSPGHRTFLIKQNGNSVVAKLDLKGFDYELDVLSGKTVNIGLVAELIKKHGEDPNVWLPIFKETRRRA